MERLRDLYFIVAAPLFFFFAGFAFPLSTSVCFGLVGLGAMCMIFTALRVL